MKQVKVILLTAAMVLVAIPALCVCDRSTRPLDGTYTTASGKLKGGRSSEAWCLNLGPGVPGNMENAMSWDGTNLGAQWKFWGMAINEEGAIETARDVDEYGNGWIDYRTVYDGGQFWLSSTGPWGNGTDYTGTLTYFVVTARVNLEYGVKVGVTSNVYFTGVFDDCDYCRLEYVITSAVQVGESHCDGTLPNYPAFECGACSGEYFNICCIVAKVFCDPVGTEPTTWGTIKELFR